MLQTLYSETNFCETNFFNKLILHNFQFIICTNIPHRILDNQQKRNFPFFNKGFQNFCVKLCYRHYKKSTCNFCRIFFTLYSGQFTFSTQLLTLNYLQFFVFTWHFFPCELTLQTESFNNDKNKASS